MGRTHWGDPADPPGQRQKRYSKATGPSPARLHRGPWQTSPGAMEATVDRRAGTQSRRGSPAKQSGPATQVTRVRRSYRRLAGAIPLVVRDTPHGWAAPRAAAQRRGMWPYPWTHVGTPSHLGHTDRVAATMPSQAHAGAAQETPDIGQWVGQDVPLVRPSSCNVKGGIPSSRRYLPTYLDASVLWSHVKQETTGTEVPVHTALAFDASTVSHHALPGNTKPSAPPPQSACDITTPVKSHAHDRKGKSVEFGQPHIHTPRHVATAQPLSSYGTHGADSCSCRNDDELRTLQSEIDCLKVAHAQLEGRYGSLTRQDHGAHWEPPLYVDIH